MLSRLVLGFSLVVSGAGGCSLLVDTSGLTGSEGPKDGALPDGGDGGEMAADATLGGDGGGLLDGPDGSSSDGPPTPPDTGPSQRPYAAAVLSDRPVLYLPLGEPAGSTSVADVTGNAHPKLIGRPTFGRPGAIAGDPDTAAAFDQSGIDCGSVLDFSGRQPFTLELWARVPSDVAVGEPRFLLRKGDVLSDGGQPLDAYGLYFSLNAPGIVDSVFSRRAGGLPTVAFPPISVDASFHHIVGVFNGTQLLLYRDTFQVGFYGDTDLAGSIAGSFYVALRDPTNGFARTEIDEVAVYDSALPQSRIQAHHDIGVGNLPDK